MAWRVRLSTTAQIGLRGATEWLSQPGAGKLAQRKLNAIRAGIKGLSVAPFRPPAFSPTSGRKCSVLGGYEIHYRVVPDPPGSTTSGIVNVLFVKGPYQDYAPFIE